MNIQQKNSNVDMNHLIFTGDTSATGMVYINCITCSAVFHGDPTEDEFDEFVESHENPHTHHCFYCPSKFTKIQHLTSHLLTSHPDYKFTCSICDFVTFKKSTLELHIQRKHNEFVSSRCEECRKIFKSDYRLRCHQKAVHITGICKFCGFQMKNRVKLRKHIYESHKTEIFTCAECSAGFLSFERLKKHKEKHNDEINRKKKLFECTICGKFLTTKSNLNNHVARHFKGKMAICEVCGMSFASIGNFRRHFSVHLKSKTED